MNQTSTKPGFGLWAQFIMLGFASFLLYYAAMAQTNFWQHFFSKQFVVVMSFVYCTAELIGSVAGAYIERKMTTNQISVVFFIIALISIALLLPLSFCPNLAARKLLISIPLTLSAITSNIFYALIIGCAAKIDAGLTRAVAIGVGVCQCIAQGVEDIISMIFDPTGQSDAAVRTSLIWNAASYYSTGFCSLIVAWVVWNKMYKIYKNLFDNSKEITVELSESPSKQNGQLEEALVIESEPQTAKANGEATPNVEEQLQGDVEGQDTIQVDINKKAKQPSVLRKICPISVALGLSYFVAALMFPLFIINIPCKQLYDQGLPSSSHRWTLVLLTAFMFSDFLGRMLTLSKGLMRWMTYWKVTIMAYCRVIYLVLCPLVSVVPKDSDRPLLFNDLIALIVTATCGLTASFIMTAGYVAYQQPLQKHEVQRGSFLLNIFLQVGMMTGALTSMAGIYLFDD